jgi:hypothetical protein
MFEHHPEFEEPADGATIWRYMDLVKLTSLLDTRALYFTQVKRFRDPYEDTYSGATCNGLDHELRRRELTSDAIQRALENFDQGAKQMPFLTS